MTQPPPYPQQPQWAPQPPPPKKNTGKIIGIGCASIVGALVVVGVIGALASSGSKPTTVTTSSPKPATSTPAPAQPAPTQPAQSTKAAAGKPEDDVKLSDCQADPVLHWPSAGVTITNHTAKSSNYLVQVEFVDASGTRVGQGIAATNNLAAGQSAVLKAQGAGEVTGQITCKVSDVTRYPAP